MRTKRFLLIGSALMAIAVVGFGGWIVSLPAAATGDGAPDISPQETESTLRALKPPKRQRPLIAIIGINDATETTDYVMPFGILRRADIADVVTLATDPGPVTLYPALKVQPQATVAEFDSQHPDGADYVIVPAMSRDDDPAALDWIRKQAGKGATIIAICAGAKVLAAAGLLNGHRATTHWYFLDTLRENRAITYVANRRIVVDPGVATTTGITASMPMMLTLIEAIAGRARADSVARELGLSEWDARHDSGAFLLTRPFALTVLGNVLAFWRREELGLKLAPGMDEVSLALVADAWSRTYRSRALTFGGSGGAVETRNGLRVIPESSGEDWPGERLLPAIGDRPPATALDAALGEIGQRYGDRTAAIVATQLEYPRHAR